MMAAATSVPTITQHDLIAFHARTFGSVPPQHSLPQPEDSAQFNDMSLEPDDDDLGFYPDGKRRTLTEDQIFMFRSSEIYNILRKRELAREQKEFEHKQELAGELVIDPRMSQELMEEGESNQTASQKPTFARKRQKKQKLEPLPQDIPEKEGDVPSRRVIRELDDVQAEEHILDY